MEAAGQTEGSRAPSPGGSHRVLDLDRTIRPAVVEPRNFDGFSPGSLRMRYRVDEHLGKLGILPRGNWKAVVSPTEVLVGIALRTAMAATACGPISGKN